MISGAFHVSSKRFNADHVTVWYPFKSPNVYTMHKVDESDEFVILVKHDSIAASNDYAAQASISDELENRQELSSASKKTYWVGR